MNRRVIIIGLLLLTVGVSHWLTPTEHHFFHALHVTMRKMFLLPVVLAAIWFGLRGACLAALTATVIYVPHMLIQWQGQIAENLNQVSDLIVVWTVALLAGWLAGQEKSALRTAMNIHRGTLLALVAALDAREHDTESHSLRVRAYALRIGQELGLPHRDKRILEQAALLHDVGKIGVPDHILLKPGPLDDRETQIIRTHAEIGFHIVRSVPSLAQAAEAVYAHHEKFDGSGYPRGLRGTSTPFAARIFAIADAFDALTSDRPYRAAVPIHTACEVIEKDAGQHFDPNAVEAFLRIPQEEWTHLRETTEKGAAAIEPEYGDVSLR